MAGAAGSITALTTNNITFGRKYKDTVAGTVGIATAYCVRQSGANRALLEGIDSTGRAFEQWVDVSRLAFEN